MLAERLLFRGKHDSKLSELKGEWVVGRLFAYPYNNMVIYRFDCLTDVVKQWKVIYSTVGQCTGLKDNKWNYIFEGDVIRWKHWNGEYLEGVVKFDEEWLRFCVQLNGAESFGVNEHLSNDIEVIGNIHDNPELIE